MSRVKHAVEELHRGEWKPLIGENKKPKIVFISPETAERLNVYAKDERIRYVLAKEEKPAKAEPVKEIEVIEPVEEAVAAEVETVEVETPEVEAPKANKGGRPKK